jgi:hypothetical protein
VSGIQTIKVVEGTTNTPPSDVNLYTVNCPSGMHVVSGGGVVVGGTMWASKSYDGTSWSVGDVDFNTSGNYVTVDVYCSAGVGSFGTALKALSKSSATERKAADLKSERALVKQGTPPEAVAEHP